MNDDNNNKNAGNQQLPKPVIEMKIAVMSDNSVVVSGLPSNLIVALNMLADALKAVASFFLQKAREGDIDKNLTAIASPIVVPNSKLVTPKGEPIVQ